MDVSDDLDLAHRLADAADNITSTAFRQSALVSVEMKPDGSSVTNVDREVERILHAELIEARPHDAILGEEIGRHGTGERLWVVDGIDGTSSYVSNGTMWSTQIALMAADSIQLGVSTSPAQGRRWWGGRGYPAQVRKLGASRAPGPRPLQVSTVAVVDSARFTSIPRRGTLGGADRALIDELSGTCHYVDPTIHGAKLVAAGEVEACIQLRGGPWDFAALAALVHGAGGFFSDIHGHEDVTGGGPVLYSNGRVHDRVLSLLAE